MTPALLRAAGEALYGPLWQSELARALGVADRTMRRWVAGTSPVPDLSDDLGAMIRERRAALAGLLRRL